MGKDKEDSGFGFKDKAKAVDTLRLLEEHDMNYRRLTVRGLLGRAKRVLSLTKAEDKIKNIKEAMEVFENWLEEQSKDKDGKEKTGNKDKAGNKEKKDVKKKADDSDEDDGGEKKPTDTVPGLGFKDAATAEGTLKALEGRDPEYQRLAVKGLVGRAERSLTCTKDETKVSNIKSAIAILNKFLDDYDSQHLAKQNNAYVSLGIVKTCLKTAEERGLDVEHQKQFIAAYSKVGGDYKKLRTVAEKDGGKTWDIVRNTALKELKEKLAKATLFNDKNEPTDDHLHLLLWAYSPEAAKVKKHIPETKDEMEVDDSERRETRKRKSSGGEEAQASKRKKE